MIYKIISGGQTGADQGALEAGKELGLKTGGYMPRGWRTDTGPRPDMEAKYDMREHGSPTYPPRTRLNVQDADATLIFGDPTSPGCRLTISCAVRASRPHLVVYWRGSIFAPIVHSYGEQLQKFLIEHDVKILNVAGNRESRTPGIHDAARDFLIATLGK